MNMKSFIGSLRGLVVALCLLQLWPTSCFALQGKVGKLTWQLSEDSTMLVISGTGYMKDYCYASDIAWYPFQKRVKTLVLSEGVLNVGNLCFKDFVQLSTLNLPSSIVSIGQNAFSGCSSLESVSIPNGVTYIRNGAFSGCSGLVSVDIPKTVFNIESGVFEGCASLSMLRIPSGITSVASNLCSGCTNLSKVIIPNTVVGIEKEAFYKCASLDSVNIPNGVASIGMKAFCDCSKLSSMVLPESVNTIGESAFSWCSGLGSVSIPSGVECIGKCAFSSCSSLRSVSIPASVVVIGEKAFMGCEKLKHVDIPEGLACIDKSVFENCVSLDSVLIPSTITSIMDNAFKGCTSLTICENNSGNVQITLGAFEGCPLPVENGVRYVGRYAVDCDSLYKGDVCLKEGTLGMSVVFKEQIQRPRLVLPKSLLYMKYRWNFRISPFLTLDLYSENLAKIENDYPDVATPRVRPALSEQLKIEEGVRVIPCMVSSPRRGGYVQSLEGYNLESLSIPNGVEVISNWAFYNSKLLSSVTIPESVKYIGNGAFEGCSSLSSVSIPNGVEYIGGSAFADCSLLSSVNISESVSYIGGYAFGKCFLLSSISIPGNVAYIGGRAFEGCPFPVVNGARYADSYLIEPVGENSSVVVNPGTRFISSSAFDTRSVKKYLSIVLPESVEVIGKQAFYGQTALKSINIPSSLRVVESYVFGSRDARCLSLETINLSNLASWCRVDFGESNPLTWGAKLMMDGKPLEGDLNIPEGVDSIGSNAFYNQEGITSVSLPANVQKVGKSAFYGAQLKSVVSRQTNPEKYEDAFGETTYLHCPLYVPDGTYWNYVYKSGWGRFAHIKEYATEAQSVNENKVYMLSDARGYNYSVYDGDSGSLKTVEYAHKLDEDSKDNCWQVIKDGGRSYLYSLGAKRYAAVGEDKQLHLVSAPVDMDIAETKDGLSIDGKPCMFVLTDVLPTAIEDIHATATNREVQSIYSLEAQKEPSTRKGINIVRYNDGSSQKIMIK